MIRTGTQLLALALTVPLLVISDGTGRVLSALTAFFLVLSIGTQPKRSGSVREETR